jgi:plastocyanin
VPATLSVSTGDNFFSPAKLTVRAGQQVTVVITNDGQALHNWAIVNPNDPSGTHPESPLLKHGERAVVAFTIGQPGTYAFHCDVHLKEMTGTLIVE